MIGGSILGGAPIGSDVIDDQSSLTKFELLDADEDLIYIVHVQPQNPATSSIVNKFYTQREWVKGSSVVAHEVRLFQPFEFDASVITGSGLGGPNDPSVGSIEIRGNIDGWQVVPPARPVPDTEVLRSYRWDGRNVQIYAGVDGFSPSEFGWIFTGKSIDLISDDLGHQVVIAPLGAGLDAPIQQTNFTGAGGINGHEDLKGVPKPICLGICRNIQPVLIDPLNHVYQWNNGPSFSVLAVRDRGNPLAFSHDSTNIYGTAPGEGEYSTDLFGSLVRLGAAPDAHPTMDVQGLKIGTAYYDRPSDLALVMAESYLSANQIDYPSYGRLRVQADYAIGLYLARPTQTAGQVIDQLVAGVGVSGVPLGFRTFNRNGQHRVGQIGFSQPVAHIKGEEIVSDPRRIRTQIPSYRASIGYGQSWTEQNADDLSTLTEVEGGPTDALRGFVGQAFRKSADEDASVKTNHPFAENYERDTLIDREEDAERERDKAMALLGADRNFYELEVRSHRWKVSPGDTVSVSDDVLWGIEGQFIALRVNEDASRGTTILGIWG